MGSEEPCVWLKTQERPRTWKGQKGRAESPAQDLCLGLEHAGLLPHGLLVVGIVVVDAPIRGHMLTPQGPLGRGGGTEWWSRLLSQSFFSSPQRFNHQPPMQPFNPETPELEELTGGPVPAIAARKEAKGNIKSLLQPPSYPTYSSLTPSPINIPWSHQHPRLPGIPTGMIQGGL